MLSGSSAQAQAADLVFPREVALEAAAEAGEFRVSGSLSRCLLLIPHPRFTNTGRGSSKPRC